ncbi:MAG: zinc protease [Planctomycetota bacterium]|jgi:zinc protease
MEIPARRRVLDNGLTVVAHEDHSAPIVAVYVYYHVGSSREAQGKTGFAHLFEHMSFQGSEHVSDNGHFQKIQAAGGTLNGTTSQDRTNYYETLPKEHLELALFLESDRMGFLLPAMTQEKLDNQRDVVMNERRQSYENRPYGLVYETMLSALYPPDHPYSWPTIGSMVDIEAATLGDIDAFFRRWYGPNNATLVIAGDVESERAFDLAQKYFGAIQRGPDVAKPAARPSGLAESKRLLLEDRVQLPQLSLFWPTVEAGHPDEPALNLLADVLSANGSSILDRTLMIEEELASSVTISHALSERAGGLTITLRPAQGKTLTTLESRVEDLLAGVLRDGVDGERLGRLKNRMEGGTLRGLESVSARAALLGHMQCFNGRVDLLGRSLELHRAVTPEDVSRVARQYVVDQPRLSLSTVPTGCTELGAGERPLQSRPQVQDVERSQDPAPASAGELLLPKVERCDSGPALCHGMADDSLPLVHFSLVLPGGRFLENAAEGGCAALVAQLIGEGTRRLASADVPDELDGLGATLHTYAGLEGVGLRMTTLGRTLEASMALAREVLVEPRFAPEDVERLVRQSSLAISTRSDRPGEVANDVFRALIFGVDDARGRSARGNLAALESQTESSVRELWDRLRSAGQPRLCVVGCSTAKVVAAGLGMPGHDAGAGTPEVNEDITGLVEGSAIYLVDKPGAKQTELRVGHLGIRRNDPDFDLFLAVNDIVGGSFSSRINMNLREDKGWTYGARSSLDGGRSRGAFCVATAVETGVTAKALGEILLELERVPDGFTEKERAFTSDSLSRSLRRAYADTASRLAYLDNLAKYGFLPDYPNRRLELLAQLTVEQLNAAAQRHLRCDGLAIVAVGDAASIRADLEELGRGPVLDGAEFAGLSLPG